jgi:uncharacterized repeat protein (TIGR03803 family)
LFMRHPRFLLVILVFSAVLFVLTGSSAAQVVTDVYDFTGNSSSEHPKLMTPAQGRDGNLYGTTYGDENAVSHGTFFRLTPSGVANSRSFDGTNGANPWGPLTLATDGNFYGATNFGGDPGYGVLFKVTPTGSITVLHNFANKGDGAYPWPPIQGADGNFYGTTFGVNQSTVYKYAPSSGLLETIFQLISPYGEHVDAPLIQDRQGNLYGTAFDGGAFSCGTIFKVSTGGTLISTYSFPCGTGGKSPSGPLFQAKDGTFWGTTEFGGSSTDQGSGTIFKMDQSGTVSVVHSFSGSDGAYPRGGIVQATDGNLYGTTWIGGSSGNGTILEVTTAGSFTSLYSFFDVGDQPVPALIQHTNGLLYGSAEYGGAYGFGSIYSLDIGLAPFVALVQYQGRTGSTAQILGQGLTGTTGVTFSGVPAATFTVIKDTYMTAIVPTGATSGPVGVATPSGTLRSNKNFRILQ